MRSDKDKNKRINYLPKRRLLAVIALVTFLFTAVFIKLAFVVVVQGEGLQLRALEQWMRDVPLQAARGKIFDRNGVILADTSTLYTVYIRPNAVKDADATAHAASDVLGIDFSALFERIKKKGVSEITVAKNVPKEQMAALKERGVTGIYYSENNLRYYPYGDFMTSLLGFTNVDGAGQTGLEAYYEKYLAGVNGMIMTETDLIGREINGGASSYLPYIAGFDLQTTLDYRIQRLAAGAVQSAMTMYSAKSAYAAVINPLTGEVYAIAESPSYDLNNVPRDDLELLFGASKSAVVSNVYEPGSTFKILTAAIALETGAYNTESRFYCNGSHVVDGQKIRCWKTKGHGSISYAEGVQGSCNVVFMNSALAVGTKTFYTYLDKFGVNQRTGIDMSGEASGLLIAENNVKRVDLARIGFGQSIAVTPIELITAASAAVNGGVKIKPHLMQSVKDGEGRVISAAEGFNGEHVISAKTSETMRALLTLVVTGGSGKSAYVPGYTVMGKTGTAQKYEGGKIAQGKYISSFLGFSLEPGSELAVLVIVDEPQGAYYGSVVAAPLAGEIFKGVFAYKGAVPHYTGEEYALIGDKFLLPDLTGMSYREAEAALRAAGLYFETDGEGSVVTAQYPYPGTVVDKRNSVQLTLS
ncbi:MAG: PASTA domain-containing protein [Clostridiaceae bacterium]|jgi:stage V sporulation protein D (sporulation-specific penicillin-binding protein)|nr:PASTA domain-containing protein [Clostridiaceae bacterium]